MIDILEITQRQLQCRVPESFADVTELTPVCFSPVPAGARLKLDGQWQWGAKSIRQPGKVFYLDSTGQPDTPDWDRVTLRHLDENESALLEKTVEFPAEWRGKRIFLRFDAVYPAARFFFNGAALGAHYSGLTPWEQEITDRIDWECGNRIGVEILRKHRFVQLDMPRHALEFSGMAQSAYCFATEEARVADYALRTDYDPVSGDGVLSGSITLERPVAGELCCEVAGQTQCIAVTPEQSVYQVRLDIAKPRPWNDEFPHLYDVLIRYQGQVWQYRTGFRQLTLAPEGPKLNGNFIKFRGVNHLTFHPEGGLYTPVEWLRRSLTLMKKANVNAIRTHFTSPPALAELCDEMGFYLLQEIPIDWGTHFIHDPAWVGPALHRIQAVIQRDRHHPSLMVWSVGNENMPESIAVAPAGWHHLRIYEAFVRQLDPSRPSMFPPPGPANAIEGIFELRFGDIADVHYSFKFTREFLATGSCELPNSWESDKVRISREEALARGWSGVWFSSEWGLFNLIPDLLNNPAGSLIADIGQDDDSEAATLRCFQKRFADEWGFMRGDAGCLGGAYFPWISGAASATPEENPWGWMRYGEDADWGVVCADLTPKPEFWALRQAFSPVQWARRIDVAPGVASVEVIVDNQFNAIDLSECVFRVQLTGCGEWMTMMRNFIDIPVSAPPGGHGVVRIPLSSEQQQALAGHGALLLRMTVLHNGFRVTTRESFIQTADSAIRQDQSVPIGPDAKF